MEIANENVIEYYQEKHIGILSLDDKNWFIIGFEMKPCNLNCVSRLSEEDRKVNR